MTENELYKKYAPVVLWRCLRLLGCRQGAEDAMHEVFLKIFEYRKSAEIENMTNFIMLTATNYCINELKSYSQRKESEDGESLLSKIAYDDRLEEQTLARCTLRKLFGLHPVSSKTIVILHFWEGLTLEETAEVVGMTKRGVQKRLDALKKLLRKIMNDD